MRELHVRSADNSNGFHDPIGIILQLLLQLRADRQHRRHAIRVPRVHSHSIHVLNEADRNHPVIGITHNFQFQFLPANYRLLDQNLAGHTCGQSAVRHHAQFFHVVNMPPAGAAQRVSRTDYHWVAKLRSHLFRFLNAERRRAFRHVDAQLLHRFLEDDAVLTFLDGIRLHANNLHTVLSQDPCLG